MITVTATMVRELRERTGVGMMECKKALEAVQGNLEEAITFLRKSGQAKVAKKADRLAAEGIIVTKISDDGCSAIMLEVNCETDFVSRDDSFLAFSDAVAARGLAAEACDLDALNSATLNDGHKISDARDALIGKLGENINLRRITFLTSEQRGAIYSYVHSNGRIGVLISLSMANEELGKDLAMHIAALKPLAILPEELPRDLVAKEKEIALASLENSDKPQAIKEKIVMGKVEKFINESVLVGQDFVKDAEIKISDLLIKHGAQVCNFARFEVGEGIEKKEVDFAKEVKEQIDNRK